jgi:hypothetical protein
VFFSNYKVLCPPFQQHQAQSVETILTLLIFR